MILRDLIDVKAICETGSFRKAAQLRGVTQPTLSNRIAHLEDQLGTRLFERGHRQSVPTALARFIASQTSELAIEAEALGREIERLASGSEGVVRIGFGPGPMRALAQALIDAVAVGYPRLTLEISSGSTDRLGSWLKNRDIDLAVCPPIDAADATLDIVSRLEVPMVVVANPGHAMFQGPPPAIREVLAHPIALPAVEARYLGLVLDAYGVRLDELPGRLVCSDYDLLVRIVASGPRYFTAGPAFAFAREVSEGRLRVLETPLPFGHVVALQMLGDALPIPAIGRVRTVLAGLLPQLGSVAADVRARVGPLP